MSGGDPAPTAATLAASATRTWDVIVIGAGPAGAITALLAARSGLSTLLLDKQRFPRAKVCGCCLNGAALETLRTIGLGQLPTQLGARPLGHVRVATRDRAVTLDLPAGVALSRTAFDTALANAACKAGAAFIPEAQATVGAAESATRTVECRTFERTATLQARVVVAADGLAGSSIRQCSEIRTIVSRNARVAGGAILDATARGYEPGTIHMAVASSGYVGLVRVEDGRLDIAAAFDVDAVQRCGGLARAAREVLASAGCPEPPGLLDVRWSGTPPLTRRRTPLAASRLVLIGDCAGYVEPFTGEGMGWAIQSAVALHPLVARAVTRDEPTLATEWSCTHRRVLGRRRRFCRWVAAVLRSPALTRLGLGVLACLPRLATPHVRSINRPTLRSP